MPSQAYVIWTGTRARQLDELQAAHRAVGGTARGRRFATAQLNLSYTVAVAAEFQGYCRDLHAECSQVLADAVQPTSLKLIVSNAFSQKRLLDKGNATESTLVEDFRRLGLNNIWQAVGLTGTPRPLIRRRLEQLNIWRNAVAHSNFDFDSNQKDALAGTNARLLRDVQLWRANCDKLVKLLDAALGTHVAHIVGMPPWT